MIIQIGNLSLQPWSHMIYQNAWARYVEQGTSNRVLLSYDTFMVNWYPNFQGNCAFLEDAFNKYGQWGKYKYKYHLKAQDDLDKFLIRMGKLTSFL